MKSSKIFTLLVTLNFANILFADDLDNQFTKLAEEISNTADGKTFEANGFKIESYQLGWDFDPNNIESWPVSVLGIAHGDSPKINIFMPPPTKKPREGISVYVHNKFTVNDFDNDGVFDGISYRSAPNEEGWTVEVQDYEMDGTADTRFYHNEGISGPGSFFMEIWYEGSWHRVNIDKDGKKSILYKERLLAVVEGRGKYSVKKP